MLTDDILVFKKYAWIPIQSSFCDEKIWLNHYLVVIMSNGITLIDEYEDLGIDLQANWMVNEFNKKADSVTDKLLLH